MPLGPYICHWGIAALHVTYFSAFGVTESTGLGQFRSNVLAKIVTDHIVGEIPAKKRTQSPFRSWILL